jgi:pimeloyl-ACP methyl ester carboxylesterase
MGDPFGLASGDPGVQRVVVKGSGHAMNVDVPEVLADEVIRFLTRASESRSEESSQSSG